MDNNSPGNTNSAAPITPPAQPQKTKNNPPILAIVIIILFSSLFTIFIPLLTITHNDETYEASEEEIARAKEGLLNELPDTHDYVIKYKFSGISWYDSGKAVHLYFDLGTPENTELHEHIYCVISTADKYGCRFDSYKITQFLNRLEASESAQDEQIQD